MLDSEGNSKLSVEQKAGFVLLLVFGILAVSLGVLQMRNAIYLPFAEKPLSSNIVAVNLLGEKTRLQTIDTDQDGLNDYEEIEFYNTSPYLADTDSDGFDDKVEIDRGTDPLCPEGAKCAAAETAAVVNASSNQTDFNFAGQNSTTLESFITVPTSNTTTAGTDIGAIAQNPTLLRQMLAQTGKFTMEQLSAVDDATLLQMAQEAMKK